MLRPYTFGGSDRVVLGPRSCLLLWRSTLPAVACSRETLRRINDVTLIMVYAAVCRAPRFRSLSPE